MYKCTCVSFQTKALRFAVVFCRETKRHFTAANNAGVTHLEYLKPDTRHVSAKRGLNRNPVQMIVSDDAPSTNPNAIDDITGTSENVSQPMFTIHLIAERRENLSTDISVQVICAHT